jgi:nucleoside-diphosphate-sugar epimerase
MKRVLLTGATGFIGRHALEPLVRRGYEIHAASRTPPGPVRDGITWHQADLLEQARLSDFVRSVAPTHLLHFAWVATPGEYWSSPENLRWVRASLQLIEEFAAAGGSRAVLAGTCAEYDWRYGFCSEGITPLLPRELYGICKHALHTISGAFALRTGVSAAWGRIFFLYGPHEHPARLVSSVIRSMVLGEPALCTPGNQIRDILHVADIADAFVALLDSDTIGPVNIGSGVPVRLKDVVTEIGAQTGRSDLVRFGAIMPHRDEPPLLLADVRRLRNEVGWTAARTLTDGLRDTIAWWTTQLRPGPP